MTVFQNKAKVRGYVMCCECIREESFTVLERCLQLKRMQLADSRKSCCMCVAILCGVHQDTVIVKEGISYSSTMECSYYAGKTMLFEEACFHCGDTEVADTAEIRQLKEDYGIVRPICAACIKEGKSIQTRNAVKVKKQKAR